MANISYCNFCGQKISDWKYKNARFCCTEHRKAYWESGGKRKSLKTEKKHSEGVVK